MDQQKTNRLDPYNVGYFNGSTRMEYLARIEAFGAIRRAAEIARELDEWAEYQADSGTNPMTAPIFRNQAQEVRKAIRAAIGSDKA